MPGSEFLVSAPSRSVDQILCHEGHHPSKSVHLEPPFSACAPRVAENDGRRTNLLGASGVPLGRRQGTPNLRVAGSRPPRSSVPQPRFLRRLVGLGDLGWNGYGPTDDPHTEDGTKSVLELLTPSTDTMGSSCWSGTRLDQALQVGHLAPAQQVRIGPSGLSARPSPTSPSGARRVPPPRPSNVKPMAACTWIERGEWRTVITIRRADSFGVRA